MKKGLIGLTSLVTGIIGGFFLNRSLSNKNVYTELERINKFKNYYSMLNQWLMLKQEGKSLEEYFVNNKYKTVAIYGMGEMGNRLYDELKNSTQINVSYAIDKDAAGVTSNIEIKTLNDKLDYVDAIIITPIFAFEDVKNELSKSVSYPLISLDTIVFETGEKEL